MAARAPGWTDHNESDPGISLLELFAFLTESLLLSLAAPSFCAGTTLAVFAARYQVSELFEIRLVSDGGTPAASSAMMTRLASMHES